MPARELLLGSPLSAPPTPKDPIVRHRNAARVSAAKMRAAAPASTLPPLPPLPAPPAVVVMTAATPVRVPRKKKTKAAEPVVQSGTVRVTHTPYLCSWS